VRLTSPTTLWPPPDSTCAGAQQESGPRGAHLDSIVGEAVSRCTARTVHSTRHTVHCRLQWTKQQHSTRQQIMCPTIYPPPISAEETGHNTKHSTAQKSLQGERTDPHRDYKKGQEFVYCSEYPASVQCNTGVLQANSAQF
jgi:hypothetical protein